MYKEVLKNAIQEKGLTIRKISLEIFSEFGIPERTVYEALREGSNPRYSTIIAILSVIDASYELRMEIEKILLSSMQKDSRK